MVFAGILSVTYFTDFLRLGVEGGGPPRGGVAVAGGRAPAGGARHHGNSVSRVDKVRNALLGFVSLVVVTGI